MTANAWQAWTAVKEIGSGVVFRVTEMMRFVVRWTSCTYCRACGAIIAAHGSARQKLIHTMVSFDLGILFLAETKINHSGLEVHDGHAFHFCSRITAEQRKRAEG